MRKRIAWVTFAGMVLAGTTVQAARAPLFDANQQVSPVATAPAALPAATRAWGVVTAWDEIRDVPTFVWASRHHQPSPAAAHPTAGDAALFFAEQYAPFYRLPAGALDAAHVARVHDTGRGGILVVLRQRVGGVDLFHNALKVLLTRDLALVALAGNLHEAARPDAPALQAFRLSHAEALSEAVGDLFGVWMDASRFPDTGRRKAGYRYFRLAPTAAALQAGLQLLRPARVKPVLFPLADRLIPSYLLEVMAVDRDARAPAFYTYVIAADDGRVLHRRSLVSHDFGYRVWAEAGGLHPPTDGPIADYSPHPTGTPDGSFPAYIFPTLVTLDGFNTNPGGDPDPWLAAGTTVTRGNNAEVHIETVAPDGFNFGDRYGQTSGPDTFDYTYDTGALPWADSDQHDAAAVMLFYTINWLHDYFYDSGFDEAAGNAQQDNHGRGGEDGDPIEAQVAGRDDEFDNNASMSTPADGESPFMMTGLWTGSPSLTVDGSDIGCRGASFGTFSYDVTALIVLADDGVGDLHDACEPIVNNVAGAIALIDRGTCTFASKAQRADQAGAIGVIIANHNPGEGAMAMPNEDPPLTITIPAVSVSNDNGILLKSMVSAGPGLAHLTKGADAFQGALDNGVTAHEWGHYLHHRLVACGNPQCGAMSEGFADFVAGHTTINEGDDPLGTYATGLYSLADRENSAYFGIRRVPYSADFTKNALTFRHISDGEPLPTSHPLDPTSAPNSEVHNAGEIWGTMMHDVYMALVQQTLAAAPRYDFDQARRRMADYLVAGISLAPPDATYTEQRDALLAAIVAADASDFDLAAEAFARRGIGTCAESPSRWSNDFTGLEESFVNAANMRLVEVAVDDAVASCDNDGLLDATEIGNVTITLQNTGTTSLSGAELVLSTGDASVTFPAGATATFGTIAPFETGTVTLQVALDETPQSMGVIGLNVEVSHPETCVTHLSHLDVRRVNYDVNLAASATDTVESLQVAWTEDYVGYVSGIWNRVEDPLNPANHLFHCPDTASPSDTRLVSPPLEVSDTEPLRVTFVHRFSFEYSDATYWDGGVIEVSTDGGNAWHDVNITADPGYVAQLTDVSGNPLSNRWAYAHENPSWPDTDTVTLDFGTTFAGDTLLLRFRVGTDQAAGGHGWEIDDIAFEGITNTPFAEVVADQRLCWGPVADAGPDQTVRPGQVVTLDGSGSRDPRGGSMSFGWAQLGGPDVTVDASNAETAIFTAPDVTTSTTLTFELTVGTEHGTDVDEVQITVDPDADIPDAGPDGGTDSPGKGNACSCDATGPHGVPPPGLVLLLCALGLFLLRRRLIT